MYNKIIKRFRSKGKVFTIFDERDGIQTAVVVYAGDLVGVLQEGSATPELLYDSCIGAVRTAKGGGVSAVYYAKDAALVNGWLKQPSEERYEEVVKYGKSKPVLVTELRNWIIDKSVREGK